MQRAEMRDRLGEHRDDLVFLRYIRLNGDGAPAKPLDLMRHIFGRCRIGDVVDDDIGTGPRQADGGRLADPGIGAGHQSRLADQ